MALTMEGTRWPKGSAAATRASMEMKAGSGAGRNAAQVWWTAGAPVVVRTRPVGSAPVSEGAAGEYPPSENVKVEMTTSFQNRAWPYVARPLARGERRLAQNTGPHCSIAG
jgi:hypothetical protein